MKYKYFEIAIIDGDGVCRYTIPCTMEQEQTIDYKFLKAVKSFAAGILFHQGFETYGMKTYLENQGEENEKAEYHYEGGYFESQ